MVNIEKLDNIRKITGVRDFENATVQDFKKIQSAFSKGDISKDQLQMLVKVMPNFVELQQGYVDGLKSVINSAKDTQQDALKGISKTLDEITMIIKIIAEKSDSEELNSKIVDITIQLADYGLKVANILKEANDSNNDVWKYIAGGLSVVTLGVLGMFFRKK